MDFISDINLFRTHCISLILGIESYVQKNTWLSTYVLQLSHTGLWDIIKLSYPIKNTNQVFYYV